MRGRETLKQPAYPAQSPKGDSISQQLMITHFLGGGEDPTGNTCKAFRTVLGI